MIQMGLDDGEGIRPFCLRTLKSCFLHAPPPPQLTHPERKWGHLEAECEYLCIYFNFHVILSFPLISVCYQPRPTEILLASHRIGMRVRKGL